MTDLKGKQGLQELILKGVPAILSTLAAAFLLYTYFFWDRESLYVLPGIFSETIPVPVQLIYLGDEVLSLLMDNFLLFQNFESIIPQAMGREGVLFAYFLAFLMLMGLTHVSYFKRIHFILAMGGIIFMMAFSGINGLNIGGISTNFALMALLLGLVLPTVIISFFLSSWGYFPRFLVMAVSGVGTFFTLIKVSPISDPAGWIIENSIFPAAFIAVLFFLHIGHAVISSSTIFLIKLNKGTGLKIIWHIVLIFLLYFLLLLFGLLAIMGEVNLPYPTVATPMIFVLAAALGYGVLAEKLRQTDQPFSNPLVGQSLYWIGFAISAGVWAYAYYVDNEPLYEFFSHTFLYAQLAISTLFFLYLLANFSQIINTGRDVEKVLFKPQFFAYFHMRIGSAMAMVILVIYADGIIASQVNAANLNAMASYYQHVDKPLEAAILYENSWLQYRKNDRAKNVSAHLRFQLRQTKEGMESLQQAFDYNPSIPSTLLLTAKLHQQNKVFEAIAYLEKGLSIFPEHPYLLNNLSLLYSKVGKGQAALETLAQAKGNNPAIQANQLALALKHGYASDVGEVDTKNLPLAINALAAANQKGDFASFDLGYDPLPSNFQIQNALLRNQWTNKATSPLDADLALVDSLVSGELMSFEERNLRESRLIRLLQEKQINESLKYLNGLAQSFANDAGYYHSISAKILMGELDFQKAAVDIRLSEQGGFKRFEPLHLAALYFGGKPDFAEYLNARYGTAFPDWMSEEMEGDDRSLFFQYLANLHQSLPESFLEGLDEISDPALRSSYAIFLLKHKLHWLSREDFELVKSNVISGISQEQMDVWYRFVHEESDGNIPSELMDWIGSESGLTKNAYWAPLIWKAYQSETDVLHKYEILQDAIQFNQDPLLWIQYVSASRKLGLDHYGSNAIAEMSAWVSPKALEKLQLENL